MRRYYIGLAIIMTLVLGSFVYAISQAGDAKTDKKTLDKMTEISSKLDTYIYSNDYNIPTSLGLAGVKDVPSTITYQRLGGGTYKICVTYRTASNTFDAGWFSLLDGSLFGQSGGVEPALTSDNSYLDSSRFTYNHKKGQTCQTVKPLNPGTSYSGDTNATSAAANRGVYVNCSIYSESYGGKRTAKIKSIDTANHIIYLDTAYIQNYQQGDGYVSNPSEISSISYNENTSFYDMSCSKIDDSNITAGQKADFYVNSQDDTSTGRVEVISTLPV